MNELEEFGSVASPCVGICALDAEDDCMGCGRSLNEIRDWSMMSNLDKQSVLDRIDAELGPKPEPN